MFRCDELTQLVLIFNTILASSFLFEVPYFLFTFNAFSRLCAPNVLHLFRHEFVCSLQPVICIVCLMAVICKVPGV